MSDLLTIMVILCCLWIGSAQVCPQNCERCQPLDICQSCKRGFYLALGNDCRECPSECEGVCRFGQEGRPVCGQGNHRILSANSTSKIYRIQSYNFSSYLRSQDGNNARVNLTPQPRQWQQWRLFKQPNNTYMIYSNFNSSLTPNLTTKTVFLSKVKNFTQWEIYPDVGENNYSAIYSLDFGFLTARQNLTVYLAGINETIINASFWKIFQKTT